jgi:hypothetical protein
VLREFTKMELRYQAVMAVQVDGLEVTVVAEKFGVSRQTVHAWLRRYEQGGLEALADRSHRPVSCPQVLTDNGRVFTGRFSAKPIEVLFDRICRENDIHHLLTAPRSPTTTGKIERFHRTLRVEFLSGRVFDDLPTAQTQLDEWIQDYNTQRPHSACDMEPPVRRFANPRHRERPADIDALADARVGDEWITRHVATNGVITVAYQQISVGKHREGRTVDVRARPTTLEVWDGNELIKTVARSTKGAIRKKRAATR